MSMAEKQDVERAGRVRETADLGDNYRDINDSTNTNHFNAPNISDLNDDNLDDINNWDKSGKTNIDCLNLDKLDDNLDMNDLTTIGLNVDNLDDWGKYEWTNMSDCNADDLNDNWDNNDWTNTDVNADQQDEEKVGHFLEDIDISDNYIDYSDFTGMTFLPDGRLAVVNNRSHYLVVVDVKAKMIVSRLLLPSEPWDITKIPQNRLAITLFSAKTIQIVQVSGADLTLLNTVKTDRLCLGIAYGRERLIVVCPPVVQIMNLSGDVYKTFNKDAHGNRLFREPLYVTVGLCETLIYVSDTAFNEVVCLNFDGDGAGFYHEDDLYDPYNLTVACDKGVYVCGRGSSNIHLMTFDCKKVKVILKRNDGISSPSSIAYCPNEKLLCLTSHLGNVVKVYRLCNM